MSTNHTFCFYSIINSRNDDEIVELYVPCIYRSYELHNGINLPVFDMGLVDLSLDKTLPWGSNLEFFHGVLVPT